MAAALVILATSLTPSSAFSQPDTESLTGSTAAQIGGGLLGFYSGAVLGSIGAMIPCNQTYIGIRCVQLSGAVKGMVGLVSGLSLGGKDTERIESAAVGSLIGFGAGAAVGLVIRSQSPIFGWADVATLGMVGGAWGASWLGATVGLAGGAVIGLVLWQAIPSFDLPNAAGAALAGMALGGVTSWVIRAVDASASTGGVPLELSVPLTVSF
jgi:hypothetical protein